MAFNYGGDPAASDVAAVRFEISDTNPNAPLLQDAEVAYAILAETTVAAGDPATITGGALYAAAARCMETLARNFAMQADTESGTLKTTYSKAAVTYASRAAELRAKATGYHVPYAGGQSFDEKRSWAQDPDKVPPSFRRDQFGNPWAGARDGRSRSDLGPPYGD